MQKEVLFAVLCMAVGRVVRDYITVLFSVGEST